MTKRSFFAALAALCVSVALFSCLNIDSYESDATTSLSLTFGNPSAARAAVGRAADDAQDEFPKVVVKVEGDGVSQEKSVSYDKDNESSGARIDFDGLPAGTPLVVTAEYWNHDQIKVQEGSTPVTLRPGANNVLVQMKDVPQPEPEPTESNLTLNVKFDGGAPYPSQPSDLAKNSEYAKKWQNGSGQYVGGYPVEFLIDVEIKGDNEYSTKQQKDDVSDNKTAVLYSGGVASPQIPFTFDNLPAGTYTVKVTAVMNDCPATRPDGSIPSGTYSGTATVQIPQETTVDVSMQYSAPLPTLAGVTANPPSNNGNTELTQGGQVTFSSSDGAKLTLSVSPDSDVEITDDTVTFNGAGTTYTVTAVASKSGHIPARNEFTYKTQTPQLPQPTLTVTGATQEAGDKYYTNGDDVTVKAGNTSGLPAGTRLYYKIGNNAEQNVEPATGFTLPIQGSAYSVQYWYGASNYRESVKKTSAYTVWLDSSQIKVTATSQGQSGTSGNAEATGSSTSLAHQFYGVTGSTFTFSIASGASGISVSQSTAIDLGHGKSDSVSVRAMKGGAAVSETVTFTLSATMRPITFTLSKLQLWVGFDDGDYGTIGGKPDIFGDVKIKWPDSTTEQVLWSHSTSGTDLEIPKGSTRDLDRNGQTTYTATDPSQQFWLYAYIGEEDNLINNTVMNKNMTRAVTDIYDKKDQVITSDKNDCRVTFTFTVSQ